MFPPPSISWKDGTWKLLGRRKRTRNFYAAESRKFFEICYRGWRTRFRFVIESVGGNFSKQPESMHGRLSFPKVVQSNLASSARDGKRRGAKNADSVPVIVHSVVLRTKADADRTEQGSWPPWNGRWTRTFARSENIRKWTHVLRFVRLRRNTEVRLGFSSSAIIYIGPLPGLSSIRMRACTRRTHAHARARARVVALTYVLAKAARYERGIRGCKY